MVVRTAAASIEDVEKLRKSKPLAPRVETWISTPHGTAFIWSDNWDAIADVQEALLHAR